jgi:hypothetical protein
VPRKFSIANANTMVSLFFASPKAGGNLRGGSTMIRKLTMLGVAVAALAGAAVAQEQPRAWKPGTVWRVNVVEVMPGRADDYMRMLNTVWKAQRMANQKSGHEKSYKIMWADDQRDGQPNLVLMIEYPNMAAMDRPPEEDDKVNAAIAAQGIKAASVAERDAMRKQRGSRLYHEVQFK